MGSIKPRREAARNRIQVLAAYITWRARLSDDLSRCVVDITSSEGPEESCNKSVERRWINEATCGINNQLMGAESTITQLKSFDFVP